MASPVPSPGPQSAVCYVEERRSATRNELTVWALGLPALRRVRVVVRVSNKRNQEELPAPFWVSARTTCKYPITDLAPCGDTYEGAAKDIWAAPSLVYVPSLGGPVMATFLLYIPDEPRVVSATLNYGALELDTARHSATLAGMPLDLTLSEWTLLEMMVMLTPQVASKARLLQTLSGWDKDMSANAIEVHVSRLRAKLADSGICIRTVRGIGYRLDDPKD